MVHSRKTPAQRALPSSGIRGGLRRLKLLLLSRPRLVSNLLALVALFSIGFV